MQLSSWTKETFSILSRILLASIGSLGDIHPMIAIGLVLKSRGHEVVFATSSYYHNRLEQLGFITRTLRPDSIKPTDAEMLAQLMDLRKGTGLLLRDYIFANIRNTYEDLSKFATGADAILVSELVYAGRLVAETRHIPWAFLTLAPSSFFSVYDMPVLPGREPFAVLHKLGPSFNNLLIQIGKWTCASWPEPYYQLRQELGLPPQDNPIFHAKYSPHLVLAAFSSVVGKRQKDWPASTVITGFAYHDSIPDLFDALDGGVNSLQKLKTFLAQGDPPIVFTLGSAAMFAPGTFYEESLAAAKILKQRAVFLMGQNPLFENLPDTMLAFDYIPFQDIFPYASIVVHQGGIGTSAQALRFGIPTLCVPYSHDQPDNARRLESLGTSLTLRRKDYSAARVAAKLERLLNDQSIKGKAKELAQLMQEEDGATVAADNIEKMITDSKTSLA
jgi:UDP:flavonoid glycosyltransferase YjiC (YdhE family)